MYLHAMIAVCAIGFQAADAKATDAKWITVVSKDGNFVVDLPGKPTRSLTRAERSRQGQVKITILAYETPDVDYVVRKIDLPRSTGLKAADIEAILDFWRDDMASGFNGKVITQKKLRLDSGAYGRDFTIEGRPEDKGGLATVRVREYLSQKAIYFIFAITAADRELPEDVGHFFASFALGTKRTKKFGPHPEPTGTPLGNWGMLIDPDNDCKIEDKGDSLVISLPETHHDLNADNDKLNAPRVLREVTGDFTLTVKVDGDFKPSEKSTNPKAVPYIGGGIVIWQDSQDYIFLGRAAIFRSGKRPEFAAFEEREWGTRGAMNNRGLTPGPVYLKIERRGQRILGYTSKDGKDWARLDPMETSYPSTIKVGLYAINGSNIPTTVRFEDYQFDAK